MRLSTRRQDEGQRRRGRPLCLGRGLCGVPSDRGASAGDGYVVNRCCARLPCRESPCSSEGTSVKSTPCANDYQVQQRSRPIGFAPNLPGNSPLCSHCPYEKLLTMKSGNIATSRNREEYAEFHNKTHHEARL